MNENSLTPTSGTRLTSAQLSLGSYHVEGSGSFQFDFDIDSAAFQAQGNTVPTNPAATAFINNFSGFLDGSYQLSAEIDGSVKDITTLNGAQLAGYGISATGNIEFSGPVMRLPQVKMERLMYKRMRAWTIR